MNGNTALSTMQFIADTPQDTMNVLSTYTIVTDGGEYCVVVADRMEDLEGEVGFYTIVKSGSLYRLNRFIGLCKDQGEQADYTDYLRRQGLKVVARYQPWDGLLWCESGTTPQAV